MKRSLYSASALILMLMVACSGPTEQAASENLQDTLETTSPEEASEESTAPSQSSEEGTDSTTQEEAADPMAPKHEAPRHAAPDQSKIDSIKAAKLTKKKR